MPDELHLNVQFELKLDVIEDYETVIIQQQRAHRGHGATITIYIKQQNATEIRIKSKVCVFQFVKH
jgi:hypothetical protein